MLVDLQVLPPSIRRRVSRAGRATVAWKDRWVFVGGSYWYSWMSTNMEPPKLGVCILDVSAFPQGGNFQVQDVRFFGGKRSFFPMNCVSNFLEENWKKDYETLLTIDPGSKLSLPKLPWGQMGQISGGGNCGWDSVRVRREMHWRISEGHAFICGANHQNGPAFFFVWEK